MALIRHVGALCKANTGSQFEELVKKKKTRKEAETQKKSFKLEAVDDLFFLIDHELGFHRWVFRCQTPRTSLLLSGL